MKFFDNNYRCVAMEQTIINMSVLPTKILKHVLKKELFEIEFF